MKVSGPVLVPLTACVATVALAVGIGFAADSRAEADVPIPRVCWFSDYANAKLSNRCVFDKRAGGRWLMEVDGRVVPALTQRLPVANLCHYFHGTDCPERAARDEAP